MAENYLLALFIGVQLIQYVTLITVVYVLATLQYYIVIYWLSSVPLNEI